MKTCELCREGIASVFRPDVALCKPCHREVKRREAEDNEVPNAPTCAVDGTVLNESGSCAECVLRSIRAGHDRMRVAS